MAAIDLIPFNQVVVVERLSQAPLGAILQVRVPDSAPVVVIRASIATANGVTNGIVPLEGEDAGVFYSDSEVDDLAALNITTLVIVALTVPGPARLGINAPPAGCVCQTPEDTDFALSVRPNRRPDYHAGYVFLSGDKRGVILRGGTWVVLGRAIVIPRTTVP